MSTETDKALVYGNVKKFRRYHSLKVLGNFEIKVIYFQEQSDFELLYHTNLIHNDYLSIKFRKVDYQKLSKNNSSNHQLTKSTR